MLETDLDEEADFSAMLQLSPFNKAAFVGCVISYLRDF